MNGLPDFMIIGASRCGTTSLHMHLAEHPDTIPPSMGKELTYFNLLYEDCPINWYMKCWPQCDDDKGMVRYESSTDYLFYPEVPGRVLYWMPECKFIVLLRNPARRAWSEFFNYWMKQFGTSIGEFKNMLGEINYETPEAVRNPFSNTSKYAIVQKGMYAKCLQQWFRYFPREQFLIIKSEDYLADPWSIIYECFEFVGLPKHEIETLQNYDMLRNPGMPCPEMPRELIKLYTDYYRPYNRDLYKLLERDFGWPT